MFDVILQASFDFLSREYAELFGASFATAFQQPLWLSRLYGRLAPATKAEPAIVSVRAQADNRLVAVLPLVRRRYGVVNVLEFADLGVSDYAAPVCTREGFDLLAKDDDVRNRIRKVLKPFDVVRIGKLRQQEVPLERLFGARERSPMEMNAYAVPLGNSYPAWRAATLDPSYRKELDKKARQLAKKGEVVLGCATDPDAIRAAFVALRAYRGLRFGDSDLVQKQSYFDFYLDVAIAGVGSVARTYVMKVDGTIVAAALAITHRNSAAVILSGFDRRQHLKNLSIGSLLFEAIARDCIERGDTLLDFTIGDEPYKTLFGAQPSPMWTFSRAGSVRGMVAQFAVEKLPVAKRIAKEIAASLHHKPEPATAAAPPPDGRPATAVE